MSLSSLLDPDRRWMRLALAEAQRAYEDGEVPVGAVVVKNGQIVGRGHNQVERLADPTAHAEMLAVRAACGALGSERLVGASLFVTLEPCAMCAGAIAAARLARVVFGAEDLKSGGVLHGARVFSHPQAHHAPEVLGGVGEAEAAALLRAFFAGLR